MSKRLLLCQAVFVFALFGLTGCGDSGPARFDAAGTVTFNGQPVPRGVIFFTPDATKGNRGVQGQAQIHDGKFQTNHGEGTVGGPHIVELQGYDGVAVQGEEFVQEMGQPLFPAVTGAVDLPQESATLTATVVTENDRPKLEIHLGQP